VLQRRTRDVVRQFAVDGEPTWVAPCGAGHINDTFAVEAGERRYCVQRVNNHVFRDVPALMANIALVTAHPRAKVAARAGHPAREAQQPVPTRDGDSFLCDGDGDYWRVYVFIDGARTFDAVAAPDRLAAGARAFARFQCDLADLPGDRLVETIPYFHDTRRRYADLCRAVEADEARRAASVAAELAFARSRAADVGLVADRLDDGTLPLRVTHNDTKLDNVLFDDATAEGLCVIDLDTVMPGSPLYDFGDAVRLGASTAAEDEQDLSLVHVDVDRFAALARGYLDLARHVLTPAEAALLVPACRLITFECGMRFLADHLNGDTYFKVRRPDHNLDRCRTHWALVADFEAKLERLQAVVDDLLDR